MRFLARPADRQRAWRALCCRWFRRWSRSAASRAPWPRSTVLRGVRSSGAGCLGRPVGEPAVLLSWRCDWPACAGGLLAIQFDVQFHGDAGNVARTPRILAFKSCSQARFTERYRISSALPMLPRQVRPFRSETVTFFRLQLGKAPTTSCGCRSPSPRRVGSIRRAKRRRRPSLLLVEIRWSGLVVHDADILDAGPRSDGAGQRLQLGES